MSVKAKKAVASASGKKSPSSKGVLATVEQCTLRITASQEEAGNANVIVEKDGEVLFRSDEDYHWLMRSCHPDLAEGISMKIFRGKKV